MGERQPTSEGTRRCPALFLSLTKHHRPFSPSLPSPRFLNYTRTDSSSIYHHKLRFKQVNRTRMPYSRGIGISFPVLLFVIVATLACLPSAYCFGAGNIPSHSWLESKAFRHGDIEVSLLSQPQNRQNRFSRLLLCEFKPNCLCVIIDEYVCRADIVLVVPGCYCRIDQEEWWFPRKRFKVRWIGHQAHLLRKLVTRLLTSELLSVFRNEEARRRLATLIFDFATF